MDTVLLPSSGGESLPVVIPASGEVVLTGGSAYGGDTYRLMAQVHPTEDPLHGIALSSKEVRLRLNGMEAPVPGGPIASGSAVEVVLLAGPLRARVGARVFYLVLLVGEGVGRQQTLWRVAAFWRVTTDIRPFPVYAYTKRLPDGTGLLAVVSLEEDVREAEARIGAHSSRASWRGERRRRDGAPVFFLLFPPDVSGEGVVEVRRDDGRIGSARFTLEPWAPTEEKEKLLAPWRLPFWIAQDRQPNRALLESFAQALSRLGSGAASLGAAMNILRASGEHLRIHARLWNAPPRPDEEDDSLRKRTQAIPFGRYASIRALDEHLRALTGGNARVADRLYSEVKPKKLDGTWKLDGSVTLGERGASLPGGHYAIYLWDVPEPLEVYKQEVERLRPAGYRALWYWVGSGGSQGLAAAVVGAKEPALRRLVPVPLVGYVLRDESGDMILTGDAAPLEVYPDRLAARSAFTAPTTAPLKDHTGTIFTTNSGAQLEVAPV